MATYHIFLTLTFLKVSQICKSFVGNLAVRKVIFFLNNPKTLDPSYKSFGVVFEGKNFCLKTKEIRYCMDCFCVKCKITKYQG